MGARKYHRACDLIYDSYRIIGYNPWKYVNPSTISEFDEFFTSKYEKQTNLERLSMCSVKSLGFYYNKVTSILDSESLKSLCRYIANLYQINATTVIRCVRSHQEYDKDSHLYYIQFHHHETDSELKEEFMTKTQLMMSLFTFIILASENRKVNFWELFENLNNYLYHWDSDMDIVQVKNEIIHSPSGQDMRSSFSELCKKLGDIKKSFSGTTMINSCIVVMSLFHEYHSLECPDPSQLSFMDAKKKIIILEYTPVVYPIVPTTEDDTTGLVVLQPFFLMDSSYEIEYAIKTLGKYISGLDKTFWKYEWINGIINQLKSDLAHFE